MKYAIYARVSPKGSGFENETSLEMQINFCKEYIKSQRGEIVDIQQDEFYSGKDMKRPGFQKLMRDLKEGQAEWECLCVYKLSRLTRSSKDGATIFEDLRAWNRGFISVTEPNFDFSTPMGRAMLSIFQAFNQFEREQTAENTRNKMISIAARGEWPVGNVPLGYCRKAKHDNALCIEPRGAEIVRDVFQMYADGKEGIRIARKYKKTQQWVYHILHNAIYLGKIPYAGEIYEGKHTPIITEELYRAVQNKKAITLVDKDKTIVTRPKHYRYPYILAGLLKCHCGRYMTPASAKSGQYFYYRCTDNISCKNRVSAPAIEKQVLDAMPLYELNVDFIQGYRDCVESLQAQELQKMKQERAEVQQALAGARKEQKKIMDLMLVDNISPESLAVFDQRLVSVAVEINTLEAKMDFLSSQIKQYSNENATFLLKYLDELSKINDFFKNLPSDNDLRRQFLTTCLESIILEKDGRFRFNFRGFESSTKDKNGCPDLRLTYSIIVDYGKKKTVYVLCCFHNGRKEHEYKKEKLFGVA